MNKRKKRIYSSVMLALLPSVGLLIGIYAIMKDKPSLTPTVRTYDFETRIVLNENNNIYFESLKEAIDYVNTVVPGTVVELLKDIDVGETIKIKESVYLSVAPGLSVTIRQKFADTSIFSIEGGTVFFGYQNSSSDLCFACNQSSQKSLITVASGGKLVVNNGNFSGNTIVGNGAIFNVEENGELKIMDGMFDNNSAIGSSSAGGVVCNAGKLTIYGGTFKNNSAAKGGALYNDVNMGEIFIKGGVFLNNTSVEHKGSFVYHAGQVLDLSCQIETNGSIYIANDKYLNIHNDFCVINQDNDNKINILSQKTEVGTVVAKTQDGANLNDLFVLNNQTDAVLLTTEDETELVIKSPAASRNSIKHKNKP